MTDYGVGTDSRVGIGYDIHRLVEGRPLHLGGLAIPHDKGLQGHSDGDVLLHAVADALLGACNLPDMGELFPDTDDRYRDADSRALLAEVVERIRSAGFAPHNVDCIVHAERPTLTAYKRPMAQSVAALLGIEASRVTVKAKTGEGLGAIGACEAMAATAVVSVVKTTGRHH